MSRPVSRGDCSQFASYLVQHVSLLYIACGCWLIVCSTFSMKCLHIDPCFCIFSQLLHNVTDFEWHVSLTSASLSLFLV